MPSATPAPCSAAWIAATKLSTAIDPHRFEFGNARALQPLRPGGRERRDVDQHGARRVARLAQLQTPHQRGVAIGVARMWREMNAPPVRRNVPSPTLMPASKASTSKSTIGWRFRSQGRCRDACATKPASRGISQAEANSGNTFSLQPLPPGRLPAGSAARASSANARPVAAARIRPAPSVGRCARWLRTNSAMPSACSRFRMRWLTADATDVERMRRGLEAAGADRTSNACSASSCAGLSDCRSDPLAVADRRRRVAIRPVSCRCCVASWARSLRRAQRPRGQC